MLPTGVTEFREMWLEVEVIDERGRTVYSSGRPRKDGQLPDGTHIFNTVFGDADGNPTINVARAVRMLHDHRILPKGYCDEVFTPDKPVRKPWTIKAALKYRSMSPSLVRLLLGDNADELPVITMAQQELHAE
jgi:hypothetical protein